MTGDPDNPIEKARAAARQALPKRFYAEVTAAPIPEGFAIQLDGRSIRTPKRLLLTVPAAPIAEAIADEWRAQTTLIDPATMPLTRLVNAAIDGVAGQEPAVRADIVKYAGTDLLCYRAERPETLIVRQRDAWDPLLAWTRDKLAADLRVAGGVVHVAQSPAALERIAAQLQPLSAITLAALHSATTLTGSAILALACLHGRLGADEAWRLAHVDEDFQIEQWGWDAEAKHTRDRKWAEMHAAGVVLTARPA